jgi:large subunit ribosomal protein L4e
MKTQILDIHGEKSKEINLPSFFSERIREDVVMKVLEAKKNKQPYSPSPVGGKQHSASGKMRHRRHVWQTHYGRGMSRIPRKVMSRSGTQFRWEGAEISSARGGRRAHPPKILSMINKSRVNKKEARIALISALSATASERMISKKYSSLDEKKMKNFPLIVEDKMSELKTKEMFKLLKKVLGDSLLNVAIQKKTVRAGKGKLRGRKYKSSAGLLFVLGEKEKLNTKTFDVVNVKNLSVDDLARGGLGRLVVYTENAIKYLEEKLK